jgi:dihydrofolate synthase/folylpolyglutamate synthase
MAASVAALTEAFSFADLVVIMAVSEDKDVPGILGELEPVAAHLVATANSSVRSMSAEALGAAAGAVLGPDRVTVVGRLDDAIELGVALADEADARGVGSPGQAGVLITGSVITAGEARMLLRERNGGSNGDGVPARPGVLGDWS